MWSWAPWPHGEGRDVEKAETEKQPAMAEGQRQPRAGYYLQRNKAAQLSPKASETVSMGGTPHRQQQVEDADPPWETVEYEDLHKLQQQVPEPRTESGTDLQAAKKKTEEYRKQHDAARMEIKSLREQLAQSKADVEQGGNVVALCERRIRQLEAEVSNLNAKHETRIKQLTQQFESILAQKGESSREAVARARTFGGDSNASAQLQLEASYQAQIHQKEREFRDKERDFQRRQQHYLSQISQLEDSRDKAKMRVGELREEMEADHQSQLQKLYGQTDVAELQRVLQEKEATIAHKNQQLQKFEKTATELTKLVGHTRGQSQIVKELRQKLARAEGEQSQLKMEKDNLSVAKDSIQDEIGRMQGRVAELEGEITELEGGIAGMKTALSESEHDRQGLFLELSKVKKQRDVLNQKCLSLQASNENLKSEVDCVLDEITEVKREASQWKDTLSTQSVEVSKLRGEVGALRRENDTLRGEVGALKRENIDLRGEVGALRKENGDLKEELEAQKPEDELAPYKIKSFSKLEEGVNKGSGSFGSIHLIEVNGVPCIAKRLHDILVGRGRAEVVEKVQKQSIEKKFRGECVFLSRLRHPNIVQFMGVHYGQDPSDLTLIMECLPMDLEKCLKQYPNLPLSIKISILLDVSYGLLHLHSQTPPIIHRDLTAANILLTSDMRAKIADLGVSKILDLHPLHEASQTAGPGAFAYMPPEALKRVPASL